MLLYFSYADQLPFAKIDEELDELAKELEDLNMPVVLSHNDIWQENLMFDKEKGKIQMKTENKLAAPLLLCGTNVRKTVLITL